MKYIVLVQCNIGSNLIHSEENNLVSLMSKVSVDTQTARSTNLNWIVVIIYVTPVIAAHPSTRIKISAAVRYGREMTISCIKFRSTAADARIGSSCHVVKKNINVDAEI